MDVAAGVRNYRAIWISDVHLGTRSCKAELLLDFLRHTDSETLYLVGDIVDGWRLKRAWYWPQAHNDVLHSLMRKARGGTRVVYIPGNHDEQARQHVGLGVGALEMMAEAIHVTADGRRFLVTHGDSHDGVARYATGLAKLGDRAYSFALNLTQRLQQGRRRLRLAAFIKHRVKRATRYVANYEAAMTKLARNRQFDGIVCGHIHHPMIRERGGVTYANDGDWVASCTALVEHVDGRLELLHWEPQGRRNPPSGQSGRGMVEAELLC